MICRSKNLFSPHWIANWPSIIYWNSILFTVLCNFNFIIYQVIDIGIVYFWTFLHGPLVYLSILVSVSHFFFFLVSHFLISIRSHDSDIISLPALFFFRTALLFATICISIYIFKSAHYVRQKFCWDFDWFWFESIYQFLENVHLNIKSSNPGPGIYSGYQFFSVIFLYFSM